MDVEFKHYKHGPKNMDVYSCTTCFAIWELKWDRRSLSSLGSIGTIEVLDEKGSEKVDAEKCRSAVTDEVASGWIDHPVLQIWSVRPSYLLHDDMDVEQHVCYDCKATWRRCR